MIKMKKNIYRIITIITYFVISVLAILTTSSYIDKKEQELLEKKYKNYTTNLQDKVNSLVLRKKNATVALTITLANSINTSDSLVKKDNLKELSLLLRKETDFKNVWFQVINEKGVSVFRSWSDKKNDNLSKIRTDLLLMLKEQKAKSTISVGSYDITFKAMVPIFRNGKFSGVLETITHFNSIARGLRKSDKVEPIIIVNKKYTKQLKENAFTKIFLKGHYIANLSVKKSVVNYIKENDINMLLNVKDFLVKDEYLIINTPIIYKGDKLANFLSFKRLDEIDTSYISEYKQNAFLYLGLFLVLLGLILFIISYYLYSRELNKLYFQLNENQKELHKLNSSLKQTVESEVSKNYEKNKMLFQQSKMAAMGEMIGNIAHQWRQPLSVITTVASGIKMKKEMGILNDSDYSESMNNIINSAQYLSTTIDDFRNFFSPTKNKSQFKSKVFIKKVFNLVSTEFRNKNIEIISDIEDLDIYTYENELLQVLINILNNSRDELIVNEKKYKRFIFVKMYKKDDTLFIEFKDNAGGIDEDIIDRIFEPYFTTKHQSQGTGIGLFMSEEIICKHMDGNIEVVNEKFVFENKEYYGAKFILSIPIPRTT